MGATELIITKRHYATYLLFIKLVGKGNGMLKAHVVLCFYAILTCFSDCFEVIPEAYRKTCQVSIEFLQLLRASKNYNKEFSPPHLKQVFVNENNM